MWYLFGRMDSFLKILPQIEYFSFFILISCMMTFSIKGQWPEAAWIASYLAMSVLTGSLWGIGRHILTLFPVFLLAKNMSRYPLIWYPYLIVGGILQGILLIHFVNFSPLPP